MSSFKAYSEYLGLDFGTREKPAFAGQAGFRTN
jgi:hypothetical protein